MTRAFIPQACALFIVVAVMGAPNAQAQDMLATVGDEVHGAKLFRLHCAQCHGIDKSGAGYLARTLKNPSPRNLADPSFLTRRTNEELFSIITLGGRAVSAHFTMPTFGGQLEALDAWDLVAFLRKDMMTVADFFPRTSRFHAQELELDAEGRARLGPSFKEDTLTVVVAWASDVQSARGPLYVPRKSEDLLKGKKLLGHLVFGVLTLPGQKPFFVGMSVDPSGVIERIRPQLEPQHKTREKLERMLVMYEGQKGLVDEGRVLQLAVPLAAGKEGSLVARELTRLYAQVLEARRLLGP